VNIFKQFLDAFKLTLYEILAVFLPGVILVEAGRRAHLLVLDSNTASGVIAFLILSYAAGLAAQGIANLVFHRIPKLIGIKQAPASEAKQQARVSIKNLLGAEVTDDELLVGICLAKIGTERSIYDRFLALRDTARILVLVLPLAWCVVAFGGSFRLGAKIAALALAMAGLLDRYFRFDQAACDALFSQFLADIHKDVPSTPGQPAGKEG
jgi:hypothetical protein